MKSQAMLTDVSTMLRARFTLLWIVTRDEAYVERFLFEAGAAASYLVQTWDVATGFADMSGKKLGSYGTAVGDPDEALKYIGEQRGSRGAWIMRDFPAYITGNAGPITLRTLKNLAIPTGLASRATEDAQAIIVISPTKDVPAEIANYTTVLEWPLPDREEIAELLEATIEGLPEKYRKTAVNGSVDSIIDAAVGLSSEEAQATFARSLVEVPGNPVIDPAKVTAEKQRAIAAGGILEFVDAPQGGLTNIGGMDNWTTWLKSRAVAFTPEARAYGLQSPKGALVVGVPGCGKSYSAKCLSSEWRVPLIRMDLGALKSKYVGESENNLRQALSQIEAIGRCVVWLDEIEKALDGATSGSADGGVSADALGAILSWMQDRQGEAFVIATANNAEKLPPELLRKGRFDEVWWVDLPTYDERSGIINAALKSHGRNNAKTGKVNPAAIAGATEMFTGAEIASLVPDAMFAAFNEGAREVTTDDLLNAAKDVVPLAKQQAEKIEKLRTFWLERARPASIPEATVAAGSRGRKIDL